MKKSKILSDNWAKYVETIAKIEFVWYTVHEIKKRGEIIVEKDSKGDLQKKLKYLELDLDDIPDKLVDFKPLNFSTSRLNNDKDHRVFRFVPIDKIDILITPTLRTDPLKDKYSKALPL